MYKTKSCPTLSPSEHSVSLQNASHYGNEWCFMFFLRPLSYIRKNEVKSAIDVFSVVAEGCLWTLPDFTADPNTVACG